jgi:hypothetical protein
MRSPHEKIGQGSLGGCGSLTAATVSQQDLGEEKIDDPSEQLDESERYCPNGELHSLYEDPDEGIKCENCGHVVNDGESNRVRSIGTEIGQSNMVPLSEFGGGLGQDIVEAAQLHFKSQLKTLQLNYSKEVKKFGGELSPWRQRILRSTGTKVAQAVIDELKREKVITGTGSLQVVYNEMSDKIRRALDDKERKRPGSFQWNSAQSMYKTNEAVKLARYLAGKNYIDYLHRVDPKHGIQRIDVIVSYVLTIMDGKAGYE